ncbi:MAG: LysE family translocator [Parasphingorhabdus sp.]|uniref:LysE family translocator n=1 Tax=Parasphingorhabdus sp. TaxID=2709688 RepID=UPI0030015085
MPPETLLLFLITDLTFCFTPGPATMVTVSHALPVGRQGGMRGALGPIAGINVGNFIWYALTAVGLIAMIQAFPSAYAALRWLGVIYLAWLGIAMLRGTDRNLGDSAAKAESFRRGFLSGLAVHMSNPKALFFYAVIIPPFVDPTGNLWVQFGTLAGLTIFTETAGLTFYAALASRARNLGNADRVQDVFKYIAAVVLICVALVMAYLNVEDAGIDSAFNGVKGWVG